MDIKPPSANATTVQNTSTAPLTELPASLQQLPRGTLLTAVVEASKPTTPQPANPQTTSQPTPTQIQIQTTASKSFDVLLNISGNKVQTQSNFAFNPGQLLKVEITTDAALRVIQVASQPAPQINQPLLQIQQGLSQALPLQQNPALLLNNLAPLFNLLESTPATHANAQIRELLATIPDLKQLSSPASLKQSINQSGIFLENKIKQLQPQVQQLLQNSQHKSPQQTLDNPKALTNLLRDNAQLSQQLERLVGQDFKAQLLKLSSALMPLLSRTDSSTTTKPAEAALLQRILQILPDTKGSPLSATPSTGQTSLALSNLPITTQLLQLFNPGLIPAQQQAPQPAQSAAGQPNSSTDLAVSTVLRQIAATLAQIQTNQLQSLSGPRADADTGLLLNSWNIEIPVVFEGQFKPIQLQINEEANPDASPQANEKTRVWKITLSFDFEELGEFFATLRIIDTSVSATFWSDKPETLQRITSELHHLNKSLHKLGLNVEELECRRGKPAFRETRLDQQLVDIKT